MPTAEAHVETDRAARYLDQLCRHGGQMSHRNLAHPAAPAVEDAECSDTLGVIRFSDGRCTMVATPDGLVLHAEAPDEQSLRRIQDGIAGRLEKIGRRDGLTVTWCGADPFHPPARHPGRRRRLQAAGLAVAVALLVALHAGGAALAGFGWTREATDVLTILIVIMVAAKLLVLRRVAARHGAVLVRPWRRFQESRFQGKRRAPPSPQAPDGHEVRHRPG